MEIRPMIFDHERLEVYRIALRFLDSAHAVSRIMPAGNRSLCEQLRRAATSVVLNIAEGAEEYSGPEKKRFYRMAKRSGPECAAALEICRHLADGDPAIFATARAQLGSIVRILVTLAK